MSGLLSAGCDNVSIQKGQNLAQKTETRKSTHIQHNPFLTIGKTFRKFCSTVRTPFSQNDNPIHLFKSSGRLCISRQYIGHVLSNVSPIGPVLVLFAPLRSSFHHSSDCRYFSTLACFNKTTSALPRHRSDLILPRGLTSLTATAMP